MTKTLSESNPSSEIDDYAEEKQEEFMRLLQQAYELGKINEFNFRMLSLEIFAGESWDEAFNHYQNLYGELIRVLKQEEIIQIQTRIIKGAEMIDNETDQDKRKQYLAVFDQLIKKLEELEGVKL